MRQSRRTGAPGKLGKEAAKSRVQHVKKVLEKALPVVGAREAGPGLEKAPKYKNGGALHHHVEMFS